MHHATVSVVSAADVAKREEEHSKAKAGEDKFRYSSGRVLHVRPEVPVVDDGCSTPEGGGFRASLPGTLINIVPAIYLPGQLAETRPPGMR